MTTRMPATLARTHEESCELDEQDRGWGHLFCRLPGVAYHAGNSLGLQPVATRAALVQELDDWAALGVEGHHEALHPWYPYHEELRGSASRLVGALPHEVVVMNSLTVNLNLLMLSFYRPTRQRCRILIEDSTFPSDSYAVRSQAALHGLDPDEAILRLTPRTGEDTLRTEDVVDVLSREGESIALVMLGAVNYRTGELLDLPAITAAGHAAGAVVGWDLAHAAGNVPLSLHDWNVDFAVWCSYKYLNGGPGAIAGAFVHERHVGRDDLPRLEGWWTTDPATRFDMAPVARPQRSADAWSMSNPPILATAPVRVSLEIFDSIGMATLRARSVRLTAYLESLLDDVMVDRPLRVLTPRDPAARGAQLSLWTERGDAAELSRRLRAEHSVIVDARGSHILRLAPVPLYATYEDCWRAASALADLVEVTS